MNDNILKTSEEWLELKFPDVRILDPDGWDRKNFDYSFNIEKIDFIEFQQRLAKSTCEKGRT